MYGNDPKKEIANELFKTLISHNLSYKDITDVLALIGDIALNHPYESSKEK